MPALLAHRDGLPGMAALEQCTARFRLLWPCGPGLTATRTCARLAPTSRGPSQTRCCTTLSLTTSARTIGDAEFRQVILLSCRNASDPPVRRRQWPSRPGSDHLAADPALATGHLVRPDNK